MNYWGNDYSTGKTSNFVATPANILNYVWTSGTSKQIYANGKSEGINPSAGTIAAMSGGGRIGHTTTGKDNHPAPEAGRGLECDKLSRTATDAMFAGCVD